MGKDDDSRDIVPDLPISNRRRRVETVEKTEVLPVRRERGELDTLRGPGEKIKLTEAQVDKVIEGTASTMKNAAEIAKGIVDIQRIRVQADADVARIDAETRRIATLMREEVDRIREQRDVVLARGRVAAALVQEVSALIRTSDLPEDAKKEAVLGLPELVKATFGSSSD